MAAKNEPIIRKRVWVAPKVQRIEAGKAENSATPALPDGNLNSFAS